MKIVVLDCPYDTMSDPFVADILTKIHQLKIRGYHKNHSDKCMPIDASDFFGIHTCLCEVNGQELNPIAAFKTTPLSRYKRFNLDFPLLGYFKHKDFKKHYASLDNFLRACEARNEEACYDSSMTICPSKRRTQKEGDKTIWEITKAMYVKIHIEKNINNLIAGGSVKLNMHNILKYWGYSPLKLDLETLDSIYVSYYNNEETIFFTSSSGHSPKSIEDSFLINDLWESRIEIISPKYISTTKKAS
ncbi:MAG: hypothetical protein Unbinned5081contig1003_18 [Prokaryotic dsDNA virus sp.]|nr:MAG: hypothetical protein Unbinned5081contig1003_18 [Prokaryotic dsDNA virus sp.]